MSAYIVYIADEDRKTHTTACKSEKELSSLLSNLDKDKYEIINIDIIGDYFVEDNKEFIVKDKNLETGKK